MHSLILAIDWAFLHETLAGLKDEFVPLSADMVNAGRAIAGTAAVFYIASRVWGHIARAEPVDFYPLFRPFVLGFILTMYTSFVGFVDSICQPVVAATEKMVTDQQNDVDKFRQMRHTMDSIAIDKKKQVLADASVWGNDDVSTQDANGQATTVNTNAFQASGDLLYTQLQITIRELIYSVVDFLYQAASLCIDTIRTFFMVLLIIIGPISIGVSVFDGFKDNITKWIARYGTVVLWAACANIFTAILSKIQVLMLEKAMSDMATTGQDVAFSSSDIIYIIFMLIGVVGYATVPALAGYIVESGGVGGAGRAAMGGFAGGAAGAAMGGRATAAGAGAVSSGVGATGRGITAASHAAQGAMGRMASGVASGAHKASDFSGGGMGSMRAFAGSGGMSGGSGSGNGAGAKTAGNFGGNGGGSSNGTAARSSGGGSSSGGFSGAPAWGKRTSNRQGKKNYFRKK